MGNNLMSPSFKQQQHIKNQTMQQPKSRDDYCGECHKIYQEDCKTLVQCSVHKQKCFKCRKCSIPNRELIKCEGKCGRFCQEFQLYEDFSCYKKLCRFQFLNIDLHSQMIKLPCGCSYHNKEIVYHIIGFISYFCYVCGRTIQKHRPNQINLCKLCTSSNLDQQLKLVEVLEKINQYQQKHDNKILKQSVFDQNQNLIISILKEQLQDIKQSIQLSQYSKFQIRNQLDQDNQMEKQCTICTLQYNFTDRKPMMVCLNQHIFCQLCIDHSPLTICPLCKDPIPRTQIQYCHQSLRLIDIKNQIKEKFSSKGKILSLYHQNLKEQEQVMFHTKQLQIQTNESYLQLYSIKNQKVKEENNEANDKKRTKTSVEVKKGSKRRKKD